jgi:LPS-assembly protein
MPDPHDAMNPRGALPSATASCVMGLATLASLLCCSLAFAQSAEPSATKPAPWAAMPNPTPAQLQSCTPSDLAWRLRRGAPQPRVRPDPKASVEVEADRISGETSGRTQAAGNVVLRQGPVVVRAPTIEFNKPANALLAQSEGVERVRAERGGDVFTGRLFSLDLDTQKGFVTDPEYFFGRTNAGGRASRIDFDGSQRASITQGDYTSCPRDEASGKQPAWVLKSERVRLDFTTNEGVAEGAVLQFLGVPILAVPVLRFPVTDERKSGWLPPNVNLDNKKGVELGVPYYWNIAPNFDATITPTIYTRRGPAVDTEFRYLRQSYEGVARLDWLPNDRADASRSRHALAWGHRDLAQRGTRFDARIEHVSDERYWKDFPRHLDAFTPRLLRQDVRGEVPWNVGPLEGVAYARLQHWQVAQVVDPNDPLASIVAPYQRSPQLGWRASRPWRAVGANVVVETELNRFTRPSNDSALGNLRPQGWRAHVVGSASRRFGAPGWWIEPALKVNAAAYRTDAPLADGSTDASRVIPTASVDSGMVLERLSNWFGRDFVQTLEPRLRYVNTPRRDQNNLPNFDAAANDFNIVSIFSDNVFSGIDRVSDTHQVTAGATTRWLDPATGAERLRLGLTQRYLFREQRITPDGSPVAQKFSDVLLFGQTSQSERWSLGAAVQYSPEISRVTRSVVSTRYSPGPYRTIGLSYRLTRDASEQVDLGWQWPIFGPGAASGPAREGGSMAAALASGTRDCRGTLYGVGRVNYSYRDSRITDAVLGVEYDAGCWLGRLVFERLSTGRAEATKRLYLQLELTGLSRLGPNPLRLLKDNVPGYRLLREDVAPYGPPAVYE